MLYDSQHRIQYTIFSQVLIFRKESYFPLINLRVLLFACKVHRNSMPILLEIFLVVSNNHTVILEKVHSAKPHNARI